MRGQCDVILQHADHAGPATQGEQLLCNILLPLSSRNGELLERVQHHALGVHSAGLLTQEGSI